MALAQQQRHRLVSISLNLASHSAKSFSLKPHQGECFFFLKDQVPLKKIKYLVGLFEACLATVFTAVFFCSLKAERCSLLLLGSSRHTLVLCIKKLHRSAAAGLQLRQQHAWTAWRGTQNSVNHS
jgi:hypothetical protein